MDWCSLYVSLHEFFHTFLVRLHCNCYMRIFKGPISYSLAVYTFALQYILNTVLCIFSYSKHSISYRFSLSTSRRYSAIFYSSCSCFFDFTWHNVVKKKCKSARYISFICFGFCIRIRIVRLHRKFTRCDRVCWKIDSVLDSLTSILVLERSTWLLNSFYMAEILDLSTIDNNNRIDRRFIVIWKSVYFWRFELLSRGWKLTLHE